MYIDEITSAYTFLGTKDRHLVTLFHWIKIVDDLLEEVRSSEQDEDLYNDLKIIYNRLVREVGLRTIAIFPCGK
jgi:hypothetical protein